MLILYAEDEVDEHVFFEETLIRVYPGAIYLNTVVDARFRMPYNHLLTIRNLKKNSSYSLRKLFTGLAVAALKDCLLTVKRAISSASAPDSANVPMLISVR
jgi:hypothetical protein